MTQTQIHIRKEFEDKRKDLRKKLTAAEATLWNLKKRKQLDGRKFRRQHGVDKYALDFYCSTEKLAIELDGEHHFTDEGLRYDEKRANYLNTLKIHVLRFENEEIFQSPDGVLAEIKGHLKSKLNDLTARESLSNALSVKICFLVSASGSDCLETLTCFIFAFVSVCALHSSRTLPPSLSLRHLPSSEGRSRRPAWRVSVLNERFTRCGSYSTEGTHAGGGSSAEPAFVMW